ncbi:hypothetical protein [Microbacterium suaedae]|uniref:phosphatase domain-containing protein n=1 Tax=Microbacterium suaedae TaxID=2067813 RepID=UPI000DA14C64|nr:hypothetical protein [Microbacterium suaedae]
MADWTPSSSTSTGALCDVRSVRHYVEAPPGEKRFKPNFDLFHARSSDCPAHDQVKSLAYRCRDAGFAIVIVTGKEARWEALTSAWLAREGIDYDALVTRRSNDYRPDHVIKAEIALELRATYNLRLAVDDRQDIIAVWHAARVPTVQVTQAGDLLPLKAPDGGVADARIEAELLPLEER